MVGSGLVGVLVGGKYRVESALGAGGMGSVFIAVQEPLGRRVALKVIRGGDIEAEQRERFSREACVVARLKCPHIVTLHDFGEHEGAPYIAMELLEGETLRDRMTRERVSPADALAFVRDLSCALRSAHEAGIVHRDLKPENVVVVPDRDRGSIAKLLDFGIAKLHARADVQGVTGGGFVVGTPGYIAPEAISLGRGDDPSVDVYALGVVLYEMLAGAPPYTGPTPFAVMMAHANAPLPDMPGDASVAALLRKLLAKNPADRPADGAALVAEIDRLRTVALSPTEALPIAAATRPSIAVRPFVALGDDQDELFAEGISEDILIALSCFKQLFVVAQNSVLQVDRETDSQRVGERLGVRYVLSGTVRRAGGRVRINAKLIDVTNGSQVWAQRYDRELDDLFAVQDEVTSAIVACVAGRIEEAHADLVQRKAPQALAAYDWLARGRALHHRRTPAANAEARAALDKAVEIDPNYAQAHAWRACVYGQAGFLGLPEAPELVREVAPATLRALELDERDAECQRLACEIRLIEDDVDGAWYHHERALLLNPNDARIVAQRGELSLYRGDYETAVSSLLQAIRLDPLAPRPFLRHLACTRYMQRDLDEACAILKQYGELRGDMLALAIAVAVMRGDAAEERRARERLRGAPLTVPNKPYVSDELRARWREGFERAGAA